jgi:hypothetical protein
MRQVGIAVIIRGSSVPNREQMQVLVLSLYMIVPIEVIIGRSWISPSTDTRASVHVIMTTLLTTATDHAYGH